jgi:ElaB/YqjD/DUF883 family membrane-anchored ribosome-binding protein
MAFYSISRGETMANITQSDQEEVDFTLSARAHDANSEEMRDALPLPAETPNQRAARLAHQAIDKAVTAARPAAAWVNQQTERVRSAQQQVNDRLETAREYVRTKPIKVIGIAIAAGWLINRIL